MHFKRTGRSMLKGHYPRRSQVEVQTKTLTVETLPLDDAHITSTSIVTDQSQLSPEVAAVQRAYLRELLDQDLKMVEGSGL
jgi:hypothetical protein